MKLNKLEIVLLTLAGLSVLIFVLARTLGAQARVTEGAITRIARPGVAFWGEPVDVELRINASALPACPSATTNSDPVYVALAIDSSGSMAGDPLIAARNAASDFVDLMDLRDDGDSVSVVDFDNVAALLTSFTYDRADLIKYIQNIPDGGGTNIADGLAVAAQQFALNGAKLPPNARKVIILLSDGNQEAPGDPIQAANDAKAAGLQVITIALGDADKSTLQQIASSPADYYETADPATLIDIYGQIGSGFFGSAATDVTVQENWNDQQFALTRNLYRARQGTSNQIEWNVPFVSQRGRSVGYLLQPLSLGVPKVSTAPGQLSLTACNGAAYAQSTPTGPRVLSLFPVWLLFIFPALAVLWLLYRLLAGLLSRPQQRAVVRPGSYAGVDRNMKLPTEKTGPKPGSDMTHGQPPRPPKPPTTRSTP